MVKLKWGMEYKGYLVSVDGYMNLQVLFYLVQCIFTTRRYASAVYAMALSVSLCVCVSVTSRIELIFGM